LTDRRQFLRGTAGTFAFALTPAGVFAHRPGSRDPSLADVANDEAFWSEVREAFEQEPGQTNLVTVVRGVTTRSVREAIATETARLNAFGPPPLGESGWREVVRPKVASFIGARPSEIALLRNTTEGVTTVLTNWPLSRGDEILTTSAEHAPFYDTLARRAARDGIVTRSFHLPSPAPSLDAIVDALDAALTSRTRLVMVGQMVLTGQIMPIRAIADRVHARGARLLVDGVLAIGQMPTDVRALDCDFYAAGFHKVCNGPRGTAVFFVKPELVEQLPPLFGAVGEEGGHQVNLWRSRDMKKFETFGAHPEAHFVALPEALDFMSRIGIDRVQSRLFGLTRRWVERARALPGFRAAVAMDPHHCAGLVAWEFQGIDPQAVRVGLRKQRRILNGRTDLYAGFFEIAEERPRWLFTANVGVFTSRADVDRFAGALEEIATGTHASSGSRIGPRGRD
jgi:isopenicillin-N epimerase